jgi:GxxExxY protein
MSTIFHFRRKNTSHTIAKMTSIAKKHNIQEDALHVVEHEFVEQDSLLALALSADEEDVIMCCFPFLGWNDSICFLMSAYVNHFKKKQDIRRLFENIMIKTCQYIHNAHLRRWIAFSSSNNRHAEMPKWPLGVQTFLYNLAHAVWLDLGPYETESIYTKALFIGLRNSPWVRRVYSQYPIEVRYSGCVIGYRYVDLIVELGTGEEFVIEVKALSRHEFERHLPQLRFYMRQLDIPRGVILNFLHGTIGCFVPSMLIDCCARANRFAWR